MATYPTNPLIPNHTDVPSDAAGSSSASAGDPVLKPPADPSDVPVDKNEAGSNPAVDLIRQKLAALYGEEPAASEEIAEVKAINEPRSRHQQYMFELSNSGKALAEIQAAWHQYYAELPDDQKREVWQEFYNNSAKGRAAQGQATLNQQQNTNTAATEPSRPVTRPLPQPYDSQPQSSPHPHANTAASIYPAPASYDPALVKPTAPKSESESIPAPAKDIRTPDVIREQLRSRIGSHSTLKVKHHLQSLLFGLGFGGLVLVVVLFSFFNEVIIAPFIQPSRTVSATPIIAGGGTVASDKNEVVIPKINLEIPLDFSAQTINENEIESGLENGVVHYPTTALPGQQGNASFFGHSSNNIFNPGKYKFAFVLLHELVTGDTFTLNYKGVAYTYQVFDKKVVEPTDVSVLNPVAGKASTAVLITCDPPGTSLRRLVVWGEQISPNPSANVAATPTPTTDGAEQTLPGNGPTLWRRLVNTITGN